jgi:hypothetical protein
MPLAGVIKLIFSSIIFIGCILALIEPGGLSSTTRILFAIAGSLVVGFYLYYTIRTAFWNLFNRSYRVNLPLVIGVIVHLIFIVYSAVDFTKYYPIGSVLVVMPFIIIGFLIGVYDVQKIFKSWNYKWRKTTSANENVIKP